MNISRSVSTIAAAALVLGLHGIPASAKDDHVMTTPKEIEWGPGPASIPDGAKAATLYGNPGEEGLFALRLKLPANYVLPPHRHPRPEVVTVVSGTFHIGMGEKIVRDKARALEAGSFFAFPPGMAHFAYTAEETVIQLNSTGPWGLTYVDPTDDPRTQ